MSERHRADKKKVIKPTGRHRENLAKGRVANYDKDGNYIQRPRLRFK